MYVCMYTKYVCVYERVREVATQEHPMANIALPCTVVGRVYGRGVTHLVWFQWRMVRRDIEQAKPREEGSRLG